MSTLGAKPFSGSAWDISEYTAWGDLPTPDAGREVVFVYNFGSGFNQYTRMIGDGTYWRPDAGSLWHGAEFTTNLSVAHGTWTTISGSDLDMPPGIGGTFVIGWQCANVRITTSTSPPANIYAGVNGAGDSFDYSIARIRVNTANDGGPCGGPTRWATFTKEQVATHGNLTARLHQDSGATETINVPYGSHVVAQPIRLDP